MREPDRAANGHFFILSLDIPSSFFIESLDMLSFDIVSFFMESFDMLSLDMVSLLIESVLPMLSLVAVCAKAAGAQASENDIKPASKYLAIRELVITGSSEELTVGMFIPTTPSSSGPPRELSPFGKNLSQAGDR